MKNIEGRLKKLEVQVQPDKPLQVIFKQDNDYWINQTEDYRLNLGGPECQHLTKDQVDQLEQTHQILMVEYVKMDHIF